MESSSKGEVVGYLKDIAKHVGPKSDSCYIAVSGNSSCIHTDFNPPLHFSSAEMALCELETYYSFPNIDEQNNKVQISVDGGKTWKQHALPTGCYEIKAINAVLKRFVKENKGDEKDSCTGP